MNDFFFIKFCPTNDIVILPDKINSIEKFGTITCFLDQAQIKLPWFIAHYAEESFLKIDYKDHRLSINYGDDYLFHIS